MSMSDQDMSEYPGMWKYQAESGDPQSISSVDQHIYEERRESHPKTCHLSLLPSGIHLHPGEAGYNGGACRDASEAVLDEQLNSMFIKMSLDRPATIEAMEIDSVIDQQSSGPGLEAIQDKQITSNSSTRLHSHDMQSLPIRLPSMDSNLHSTNLQIAELNDGHSRCRTCHHWRQVEHSNMHNEGSGPQYPYLTCKEHQEESESEDEILCKGCGGCKKQIFKQALILRWCGYPPVCASCEKEQRRRRQEYRQFSQGRGPLHEREMLRKRVFDENWERHRELHRCKKRSNKYNKKRKETCSNGTPGNGVSK